MELNKYTNKLALTLGVILLPFLAACSHLADKQQPIHHTAKIVRSNDLTELTSNAIALADQNGASKVLVIFDIDNTLLMMPQDLGGDGWFGWQSTLLTSEPNAPELAVDNFSELIYLQGVFFSLNEMTLTQKNIPTLLSSLHKKNIHSMAITARGHGLRGATLRELKNNGLTFPLYPQCKAPLCIKSGLINSLIISDSVAALRSTPDRNSYRDVSISDGLAMLAGQDKGLFLELLLASLPEHHFTHILIADDSEKNIDNYKKSAPNIDAELTLYHYTKVENDISPIQNSIIRKQKLMSDTQRIKRAICMAVQSIWCEPAISQ